MLYLSHLNFLPFFDMNKKNYTAVAVAVIAVAAVLLGLAIEKYWVSYDSLDKAASDDKPAAQLSSQDELIKYQVQTAYSMLTALNAKVKTGEIKLSYAKKLGADLLRDMRFGTDGYFFADTAQGVNVVLYGDKTVEGKNRWDAEMNGIKYVQKINQAAKSGAGFTDYFYPKKGETTPSAKRAYSLYFQPFDWVIGTGYYK